MIDESEHLAHYGILRKSGRYPWGSGGDIPQRSRTFLDYRDSMRKQGLTESEIAKGVDMTTTQLRAATSIARNAIKQEQIGTAQRLKDRSWSNVAIGERMGLNESSVRALLAPGEKDKADVLQATARFLKDQVDEKGIVDVGIGVEHLAQLGNIARNKLDTAIEIAREVYNLAFHKVQVPQVGNPNNKTTIKVLARPGTTYREIASNLDAIRSISGYTDDGGRTYSRILPPLPVSSNRVAIRYGKDGGAEADGVIYVREGVPDLSLGGSRYAQVRIAVDGTHYLKGMAIYKDDLPKGIDLVFNTNKESTGDKLDAMKPLKVDKETGKIDETNPFGSIVRQIGNKDASGRVSELTSAMNLVNEAGDWEGWRKSISTQVLSKQSPTLAQTQLNATLKTRKEELDEIMSLTNPSVRRKLLETYADDVDKSAVDLKAHALPRQRAQVIIPINTLKDTEIYAPNFRNGERVALIRYPHGGKFEIPDLTVNNKHPDASKLLGQARDAVGINHEVAKRLSGADFDGDTVLVIPNPGGTRIKSEPPLHQLKDFDPVRSYPQYEGMKVIAPSTKQTEMGKISNLITDMTIRGATHEELARAVKHSMVVIDAEKHKLNYRQSAVDNGIASLVKKYQTPYNDTGRPGASTLISRASGRIDVPKRRRTPTIDPLTGKKTYEVTAVPYVSKTGKVVIPTQRSKKLAETEDAHTLSSGTRIESIYADHANQMKALANIARREMVNTRAKPYSQSAAQHYAPEVKSLTAKLNLALQNSPKERQAQVLAASHVSARIKSNPGMDDAELKKLRYLALETARARTGAKKELIEITPREWEAIQAAAISPSRLDKILTNTDISTVKKLATPRTTLLMTSSKQAKAASLLSQGLTQAEVADILGVSLTTLKNSLT